MSIDIQRIKDALPLASVIGQHVPLTRNGNEYTALCPFHEESTPSFTVHGEKYTCFGCGAHGDVIDFIQNTHHMGKREAIQYAASLAGLGDYTGDAPRYQVEQKPAAPDAPAAWAPIIPVPADAPALLDSTGRTVGLWNPKRGQVSHFKPTLVHAYRAATGELLGYVLRAEIEGKKLTPQITYCQNRDTGEQRWCIQHWPEPRPLYGLDTLAAHPRAPVLLVEGEKTADAARTLMPRAVVVTWPGGTKGLGKVDWQPLAGRNVVMLPDADMPGQQSAWGYYKGETLRPGLQQIIGTACRLVIIDPPEGTSDGWDLADALAEGWDGTRAQAWLGSAITAAQARGVLPPLPDPAAPPPPPAQPPVHDEPQPPAYQGYDGEPDYNVQLEPPFRALGHYRGLYYYLPSRGRQIVELTASAHRDLNMLQLAPLHHWESSFPARGGQSKVDWKLAADACMGACMARGFFDKAEQLRGRGAWLDSGRSILHLGETIIADGVKMPPHAIDSRYTYQADHNVELVEAPALSTTEANKLVQICKQLTWENPRSALLLAGWCIVAPVCGILPWRPHIWLTGSGGSGKTTVLDFIMKPIVGQIALNVASSTSESGIRQALGSDARPVIFDEAESEDKQQAQRIQAVLDLCRAASAASGAKIIKGTADHGGRSFDIRSCFAFSSINTGIKHYADETRVTLLVLRAARAADEAEAIAQKQHFDKLKDDIVRTITPEFSSGLLMRTLANLPTLRANIDTFCNAASVVLGSRRAADQLAPMLAGAYLLHSTKKVGHDDALAWLRANDVKDMAPAATTQDDETRLVQYLLQHRLRLNTANGQAERTVGEMIEAAYRGYDTDVHGMKPAAADEELRRFGIKVDPESNGFYVSTTSYSIRRALADTAWANNWGRPLCGVPDAYKAGSSVHFSAGVRNAAVWLPIKLVMDK